MDATDRYEGFRRKIADVVQLALWHGKSIGPKCDQLCPLGCFPDATEERPHKLRGEAHDYLGHAEAVSFVAGFEGTSPSRYDRHPNYFKLGQLYRERFK